MTAKFFELRDGSGFDLPNTFVADAEFCADDRSGLAVLSRLDDVPLTLLTLCRSHVAFAAHLFTSSSCLPPDRPHCRSTVPFTMVDQLTSTPDLGPCLLGIYVHTVWKRTILRTV
jgi:hypothetical protein